MDLEAAKQKANAIKNMLSFKLPSEEAKEKDIKAKDSDLGKPKNAKVEKNSHKPTPSAALAASTMPKPQDISNLTREELKAKFEAKMEALRAKRGADTAKNQVKQAKKNKEKAKKKEKQKKVQSKVDGKKDSSEVTVMPVIEAGRQIFSKFDFGIDAEEALLGNPKVAKSQKAKAIIPKNPKQALQKIQQRTEKLEQLAKIDTSAAESLRKADAWTKAIQKSQGLVIKDDVKLLKKAVQKQEKAKEKRAKDWKDRKDKQEEAQAARQQKRTENIEARKEQRKMKKIGGGGVKKRRPGFEGGHFRKAKK